MNHFNITRYSVTHPIGITMIVLFFVVLGFYSYYRIGVELFPNINVPYVVVTVKYEGADAESVEQQITKPVEDALSAVSNVKHITSRSRTGRSQVTLEMNFDADVDAAAIEASQKVDAIRGKLPDDADDPVVDKRDMDQSPIVDLALISSHPLDEMYSLADNTLTNEFTKAEGVSDVELHGGRDKEIAVKIDRDAHSGRLFLYRPQADPDPSEFPVSFRGRYQAGAPDHFFGRDHSAPRTGRCGAAG